MANKIYPLADEYDFHTIDLHLDTIPEERLTYFERKDGSIGVSIRLTMSKLKKPAVGGATHCLYVRRSREEWEAGVPKIYVGYGKKTHVKNQYGEGDY